MVIPKSGCLIEREFFMDVDKFEENPLLLEQIETIVKNVLDIDIANKDSLEAYRKMGKDLLSKAIFPLLYKLSMAYLNLSNYSDKNTIIKNTIIIMKLVTLVSENHEKFCAIMNEDYLCSDQINLACQHCKLLNENDSKVNLSIELEKICDSLCLSIQDFYRQYKKLKKKYLHLYHDTTQDQYKEQLRSRIFTKNDYSYNHIISLQENQKVKK